MKDLKSFARFMKDHKLEEYTKKCLGMAQTLDLPMMKQLGQAEEANLASVTDFLRVSEASNSRFFTALANGTALLEADDQIQNWENNKTIGLSGPPILPSDMILFHSVQKKVMLHYLPEYTSDNTELLRIISEIEEYFSTFQERAVKTFCKVHDILEWNLKESEAMYRDLTENTSDLIQLLDRENNIAFVNLSWMREMGYSKEEALRQPISKFVHPEFLNEYLAVIKKATELNSIECIETVFISRKGVHLILEGLISPRFVNDRFLFTRGIHKNITKNKMIENELAAKTQELIRSNKELEQFAYVASHDLQEPLRMINSYIQLLASRYKDKLDQDAADFIHFVVDGSNRMRTLINSLLEYSRVNRSKVFESVDTGTILAEVLADMENTILENGAQIHYGHLPTVFCDPVLIGQVLQNLISNAIKFKSKKTPEIYISGEKRGDHFLFAVRDNGIGIQKEYFNKIFVIFQRLNDMNTYKGTGIGLAICKKIVERHGGNIWVESELGKGSTFYFTLKN
jgi:PAS domain S-box-containing protein